MIEKNKCIYKYVACMCYVKVGMSFKTKRKKIYYCYTFLKFRIRTIFLAFNYLELDWVHIEFSLEN